MPKTKRISILIIALIVILLIAFPNKIYAKTIEIDDSIKIATSVRNPSVIDPDDFEPTNPSRSDVSDIIDMSNVIIGTIQTIGVVVTFISLMILGIKYMTGSVEERADYKKTMIPYLIGALMFFAITQLVALIAKIVGEF